MEKQKRYFVHVDTYILYESAKRALLTLIARGYEPSLIKRDVSYQVHLGNFTDMEQANKLAYKLKDYGFYKCCVGVTEE